MSEEAPPYGTPAVDDSPRGRAIRNLEKMVAAPFMTKRHQEYLREAITQLQLGPTGEFPEGKLNQEDRGALSIGVRAEHGKVIIAFGTPVDWIGLGPGQATNLAALIAHQAAQAARQRRSDEQATDGEGGTSPPGDGEGEAAGGRPRDEAGDGLGEPHK